MGMIWRSKFVFFAIISFTLIGVCAGQDASAISVTNFEEFSSAIAGGETDITIENDLEFSALLTIAEDTKITGSGKVLSRASGYLGGLFSIPAGKTLEIDNLVIDGGAAGWQMDYENRSYTVPETNTGYIRVPTINGENDIIANASLIVDATGGNLSLKNTTVQNARIGQYAANGKTKIYGAVVSGKGNNTFSNVTFKHNGAYNHGGALYINGGTTEISNCTADGNASGVGYMGSTVGGFMYMADGNLTIDGSEFKNNYAQGNGGVAIIYRTNTAIKDSHFDHNMVGNDGSALSLQSKTDGKSLSITDSIFENNTGFAFTGQSMGTIWQEAWYNSEDEPATYKNLIFRGNSAATGTAISDYSSDNTHVSLENIEIYDNTFSAGGALYGQGGHYHLKNVDIHDNSGKRVAPSTRLGQTSS